MRARIVVGYVSSLSDCSVSDGRLIARKLQINGSIVNFLRQVVTRRAGDGRNPARNPFRLYQSLSPNIGLACFRMEPGMRATAAILAGLVALATVSARPPSYTPTKVIQLGIAQT